MEVIYCGMVKLSSRFLIFFIKIMKFGELFPVPLSERNGKESFDAEKLFGPVKE